MCGICGIISFNAQGISTTVDKMIATLNHRGPDDHGKWISPDGKIGIGHTRLSFLDLSPLGRQPMVCADNIIAVSLNGEIYNYLELREQLGKTGATFKSNTDTEVLIHGYKKWGFEKLLSKLKGMFAFSLLDDHEKKLFLARDRFGIKPLYYSTTTENFSFASEITAIREVLNFENTINFQSFSDFFVYRYVPSPNTIYEKVKKIPPAHYIEFDILKKSFEQKEYWKLNFEEQESDSKKLAEKVGELLQRSVEIHNRSEVEIGSFLSGGYDSSAIVYFLSQFRPQPKVFSIGFENWDKSEHQYAQIVADRFGAKLHHTVLDNKDLSVMEKIMWNYDEPIADISIIPTYTVSRLAANSVKAVMSGEGADEIFGGYDWQKDIYARTTNLPLGTKLKNIFKKPPDAADEYSKYMTMGKYDGAVLKELLNPDLHNYIPKDIYWFYRQHSRPDLSPLKAFQYLDIKCFMGELVLTKIDRASMAHSLEVRVPFLDHELFEIVLKNKDCVYFKPGITKFLLFQNIKDHLPREILNRKKQGFVGPDEYYMNFKWYKEILLDGKLVKEKIIQRVFVEKLLNDNDHWRLWKIAVMEFWWRKWMT